MLDQPVPNPLAKNSSSDSKKGQKKDLLKGFLILLVGALIVYGVSAFFYFYPWIYSVVRCGTIFCEKDNATKVSTSSATPNLNTTDWQVIKGEISKWQVNGVHKFEFDAPKSFQVKHPYGYTPEQDGSEYYFGVEGEGITFYAGLMEGPGPLTTLYGRAEKSELCSQPLTIKENSKNVFESCDIISVGGRDMLWLFDVHTNGGDGGGCLQDAKVYVVYNLGNYASLYFSPELEVLKEILNAWPKIKQGEFCPENIDSTEVQKLMAANINKIRQATGLSEADNQRLRLLYQILPTFKFL